MKVITAFLTAIVSLCVWSAHTAAQQSSKPIRTETSQPDFIGPAETLHETFLQTPLVIRGRVVGSRPADKPHAENRGTWIRTAHRVEVLDLFRAPDGVIVGNEVTVIQSGGDRDRGSYIDRLEVEQLPLLHPGKEYIFFLERAGTDAWGSAYGPDGIFERAGDRVHPFGKAKISLEQKGKDWQAFIRVVRNYGIQ